MTPPIGAQKIPASDSEAPFVPIERAALNDGFWETGRIETVVRAKKASSRIIATKGGPR
jgi:hypothetical protein